MGKPLALVIEDEYDISIIFARALRQAGYETSIVRSGDTALAWLSAEVPDLVILDLNLPRLPGTEILKHIRGDPRLKDVHVIVATAYPRLAESLHGQVDWILIKPVNFGQLRNLAARFSPDKEADPASDGSKEE
jgi:DNA-binding response OmpR family regulator